MAKNYKKASQEYNINESLLMELASRERKTTFFSGSLQFYNEVKDREMYTLSKKQQNWLWELSCVLHDRQQNQIEAYNTEKQSEKIEQKKENFFSRFLSRLTNYFN